MKKFWSVLKAFFVKYFVPVFHVLFCSKGGNVSRICVSVSQLENLVISLKESNFSSCDIVCIEQPSGYKSNLDYEGYRFLGE